jgi:uncharacterized protein
MNLLFSEIPGGGISIHFQGTDAAWEGLQQISMEDLPQGELFIEKLGKNVLVRGHCAAKAALTCSRCLKRYQSPMEASFRHTLRPLESDIQKGRESELLAEDLEYGYYQGDVIQLGQLVEEYLLLTMPMKPLCSDDCRGICQTCGANRNENDCQCSANAGSNPFEVLKKKFR